MREGKQRGRYRKMWRRTRRRSGTSAGKSAAGISGSALLGVLTSPPAATTISSSPCLSTRFPHSCCLDRPERSAFDSVILGRAIKNEYLALGTIFGTVGATLLATGGKKEPAPIAKPTLQQIKETVKVNASSRYVLLQFLVLCGVLTRAPCVQRGGGLVRAHTISKQLERTVDN